MTVANYSSGVVVISHVILYQALHSSLCHEQWKYVSPQTRPVSREKEALEVTASNDRTPQHQATDKGNYVDNITKYGV